MFSLTVRKACLTELEVSTKAIYDHYGLFALKKGIVTPKGGKQQLD